MRHFVVYHNTKRMGYGPAEIERFEAFTDKSVNRASGGCVWLISGTGEPRQYHLSCVFKVNRVSAGMREHPEFENAVFGTSGRLFRDSIEIGALPWFPGLVKAVGNFRFGMRELKEPALIAALEALSRVSAAPP